MIEQVPVLKQVNVSVHPNEVVAIVSMLNTWYSDHRINLVLVLVQGWLSFLYTYIYIPYHMSILTSMLTRDWYTDMD